MSEEQKEIVAANPRTLVTDDMAELMKGAQHGSDFNKEDLGTPFIVIVQSSSGYAKRSDPKYIEGAVEGDIIDTLTMKLRRQAAFIPCKYQIEYTEWEPDQGPLVKRWGTDRSGYDQGRLYVHNGQFVEWGPRSIMREGFDDQGPGTPVGDRDVKTVVVPAGVYYGLLVDEDGTSLECCLSLTGTQARKARRFNDLINALELTDSKGEVYAPPMYARLYGLSTVPERNDENSWMGWKIEPGPLTLTAPGGKALFLKAKSVRERADAGKIRVMETAQANDAQRGDEQRQAPRQRGGNAQTLNDDIPF